MKMVMDFKIKKLWYLTILWKLCLLSYNKLNYEYQVEKQNLVLERSYLPVLEKK